jgi:hypothetical protein
MEVWIQGVEVLVRGDIHNDMQVYYAVPVYSSYKYK